MTQQPGAEATYFAALQQGRFIIQKCDGCGKHVFYPRQVCPHCHTGRLQWIKPSGDGTVHSTSIVRRKSEHGGDYNVALIDLDEGVRMMSRVIDLPPTDVRIGMRVRASVAEGKAAPMVVFRTQGGAA